MAITLSISDNADGTGGIATISGSNVLATNTVYSAVYSGLQQNFAWVSAGSRTGDGTVAVAPGNGLYFWYVDSNLSSVHSVSNISFQALTNTTLSVHYRCLLAYQTRILGLGLTGVSSSNVNIKWLPRQWDNIDNANLPMILIVPMGKEGQPGILTGQDDIEYPTLVAIVDKQNQDYTSGLARNLLWRESIFRAFRHQRLVGVQEIITTAAETDYVLNPQLFNPNLWNSALLCKHRSRVARR